MNKIRVGFLSHHNYFDKNSWSGIVYHMYKALSSTNIQVINLGNPYKINLWRKIAKIDSPENKSHKIGSENYVKMYSQFADLVTQQLSQNHCDVIFAPVASNELYFLETEVPILYFTGMTFKLYEKSYSLNFDRKELDFLAKQESIAISKATRLVYPSHWPVNSAIVDYKADPEKISVVPYGANLENPPTIGEIINSRKLTQTCRLLFIGKEWERKGGEIAFQTLLSLLQLKIDAELTVVGTEPPKHIKHDRLSVISYLNKNKRSHMKKFRELLLSSNFMVFPTRAEAFGVVSCEANAFGLPVITTEVGGIPTIIRNGKNGYMFSLSSSGDDYAELIAEIFSDKMRYQNLVISSREEYDNRLNWNKWADSIHDIIMDMVRT